MTPEPKSIFLVYELKLLLFVNAQMIQTIHSPEKQTEHSGLTLRWTIFISYHIAEKRNQFCLHKIHGLTSIPYHSIVLARAHTDLKKLFSERKRKQNIIPPRYFLRANNICIHWVNMINQKLCKLYVGCFLNKCVFCLGHSSYLEVWMMSLSTL